jgi:hypothetical protein
MAMSRVMEELRQQSLRMAHFNNARPVSDHHPVNAIMLQKAQGLSRYMRVKLVETGNYDGKVEPLCAKLFVHRHSKRTCNFKEYFGDGAAATRGGPSTSQSGSLRLLLQLAARLDHRDRLGIAEAGDISAVTDIANQPVERAPVGAAVHLDEVEAKLQRDAFA